jgi:hypothetical protein
MFEVSSSSVSSETGREFEERVAGILKSFGWEVLVTPGSNDFGADLIAKFENDKLAIQCKCYAESHIGRAALQEALYGCKFYGANRAFVIYEGRVSSRIKQEANSMGIELVNVNDLVREHELDRSPAKRVRQKAEELEAKRAKAKEMECRRELQRDADIDLIRRFENHEALVLEARKKHRETRSVTSLLGLNCGILMGLFFGCRYMFYQFSYLIDGSKSTEIDLLITSFVLVLCLAGGFVLVTVWLVFLSAEEPNRPLLSEYEAAKNRLPYTKNFSKLVATVRRKDNRPSLGLIHPSSQNTPPKHRR